MAFEVARQAMLAGEAELEIELVALRKRCPACDKISGGFDFFCANYQTQKAQIGAQDE